MKDMCCRLSETNFIKLETLCQSHGYPTLASFVPIVINTTIDHVLDLLNPLSKTTTCSGPSHILHLRIPMKDFIKWNIARQGLKFSFMTSFIETIMDTGLNTPIDELGNTLPFAKMAPSDQKIYYQKHPKGRPKNTTHPSAFHTLHNAAIIKAKQALMTDPKVICKTVACSVAQQLYRQFRATFDTEFHPELTDLPFSSETGVAMIKTIEKTCFKKRNTIRADYLAGMVVYLQICAVSSQKAICELFVKFQLSNNMNPLSLRNYLKKIKQPSFDPLSQDLQDLLHQQNFRWKATQDQVQNGSV